MNLCDMYNHGEIFVTVASAHQNSVTAHKLNLTDAVNICTIYSYRGMVHNYKTN